MIALDPSQTVPFSLESESGLPSERRVTWRARYLTARERLRCEGELEQGADIVAARPQEAVEHVVAALRIGLVGWTGLLDRERQVVPFDVARLPDLLTADELYELVYEMLRRVRLAEADRKKSVSPSTDSAAS